MTLGSHLGMPAFIPFVELKTIRRSVNTNANQVMTPKVKSNLMMAFVRMKTKTPEIAEKISQS
jgi:hypothetical protein